MLVFTLFIVKHILFFLENGVKFSVYFFNVESALAVHQLPTWRQILNSRGGFLGLKIGISL